MALRKPLKKQQKKTRTGDSSARKKGQKPKTSKKQSPQKKTIKPKKKAGNKTGSPATKVSSPKTARKVKKPTRTSKTPERKKKSLFLAGKSGKKLSLRQKAIQGIRERLIFQKSSLIDEAEEALNALPDQTIFPDLGDQASVEIDRSFMLKLRGREQRLIKKIESAIERIDSNTFGICDACGQEIEIKRLEARPVTSLCIFCKTEQEEEEKLRGQ